MSRSGLLAILVGALLLASRAGAVEARASKRRVPPAPVAAKTVADDSDDEDDPEDEDDEDDADDDDVDEVTAGEKTPDPTQLTANVAITSNYLLRGLTQTENQPAIQGGFDWGHPLGFDLSAWGTNVRFPESSANIELDFSGGYTREIFKGLSVRLGALYFWYPGDSTRNSWDVESSAEWRGFKVGVDFSPSWEGTDLHSWYFNAGWSDEVLWGITPGVFAGYTMYPIGAFYPSYFDFKVSLARDFLGLTWEAAGIFTKVQSLLLTETITDPEDEELSITRTAPVVLGGSRAVFTVSKAF